MGCLLGNGGILHHPACSVNPYHKRRVDHTRIPSTGVGATRCRPGDRGWSRGGTRRPSVFAFGNFLGPDRTSHP
ncbi:hypothetical protein SCOCK_370060 [Actinacidiphila cocklensis]|uniref:Uncharacterized protein n=1 Tax=Actinacidiphila cocklensis TaxID=887465 RepID=A0A9W4E8Z5_9ACTN|nr:hypothetical protein SCOCK_370060 [Actinacidiphila cocklensis]